MDERCEHMVGFEVHKRADEVQAISRGKRNHDFPEGGVRLDDAAFEVGKNEYVSYCRIRAENLRGEVLPFLYRLRDGKVHSKSSTPQRYHITQPE